MQRGIDLDSVDKFKNQVAKEANLRFEKAIRDKPNGNGKELCIDAYEAILLDERRKELE
jgi:hypothetical protein